MAKEILLYTGLYSYSAGNFVAALEENKGSDIAVRINSGGGEVLSTFGMIAKFSEHPKGKKIKVDGLAGSMAAFMCCYADEVECLDVSEFVFHRAAYSSWIEEDSELFSNDMRASLQAVNAKLRAAMESKFKAEDFKRITGVSLDDLFSLDSRIDVKLNADQAKALGLVNKVINITPEKRAEIENTVMGIAASYVPKVPKAETANPPQQQSQNTKRTMTLAELQQQHPDTYAAAVQAGVAQERDRVGSFLAFNDIDPEAVTKGITEGKTLTATQMAEFSRKAMSKQLLAGVTADSAGAIETGEVKDTTKQPEAVSAFEAEVRKDLKLAAATA